MQQPASDAAPIIGTPATTRLPSDTLAALGAILAPTCPGSGRRPFSLLDGGNARYLCLAAFLTRCPRLLRLIPLALAAAPLFLLLEGLFAAEQQRRVWRAILSRLGAYIAFVAIALSLHRKRQNLSLSSAMTATLIFAWAIAAVFPIIGP